MPTDVKGKLREIKRRYRWGRRSRRASTNGQFAALRLRELERLYRARYGATLPDDDAGRDDALIAVHHIAQLDRNTAARISNWLARWCPWMPIGDVRATIARVTVEPMRWRADKLAWRLRLTAADRTALAITTIGAIDESQADRAKRRKVRAKLRARLHRKLKGSRPRAEYLAQSTARNAPWKALGISRRTWYRRHRATVGTSPYTP